MYKDFFGLRENPFNVNPDPRYLFLTSRTQAALDELTYGIQACKGLILLTGEVGTGKTTLINKLLEHLHGRKTPTAFIFNSHLDTNHLFDFILTDFGVTIDQGRKESSLMRLNQWLIERYRTGGETPVLIVDEAQGLPLHVLEEIRLLLNLETPHQKLLQIVLAGQPELDERLRRPDLRQLKQRITLRCRTAALTLEETREYVRARLRTAGHNGSPLFTPEAVDALHFYSRGIPRVVNLLCEHGLINAYADNLKPIPARTIREIAREFQFDDLRPVGGPVIFADALTSRLIAIQSTNAAPQTPVATGLSAEAVAPMETGQLGASGGKRLADFGESSRTLNSKDIFITPEVARPSGTVGDSVSKSSVTFSNDAGIDCIAKIVADQATIEIAPQLRIVESKPPANALPVANRQPSNATVSKRPDPRTDGKLPEARTGWQKVHASRTSLFRLIDKWRADLGSVGSSVNWTQIKASSRAHLAETQRFVRSSYQSWLVWLNKRPTPPPHKHARVNAPVSRWLRQPWTPTISAIPVSRLFSARRKFTHKKV